MEMMERVAAEDEPALAIELRRCGAGGMSSSSFLALAMHKHCCWPDQRPISAKRATSSTAAVPSPSHSRFSSSSPLASVEPARIAGLLARPVGFVNSVVADFQGNPEPVASGISAATLHGGGQRRATRAGAERLAVCCEFADEV